MPLLLFAYFALEVLAFIGVAKMIGVGWALLAVLGVMVLGGFLASVSCAARLSPRRRAAPRSAGSPVIQRC
ncbi:FxsA family protein [Corynebacterium aquatimens]|uniref:FxsA family protein n=1 Tax=Corynebacterium aquatimens TaxID=1190508 RepID=UPI00254140BA|nr:FxsA family protein [Corynebacterium aquatimens]QYH19750.1 FxsA family protein [Corynebacterium aquatimens]